MREFFVNLIVDSFKERNICKIKINYLFYISLRRENQFEQNDENVQKNENNLFYILGRRENQFEQNDEKVQYAKK